jgi:hypothetical protein
LTATAPPEQHQSTLADRQAAANWTANAAALASTQPDLVVSLPELPPELSFVFGRDGSLTAMNSDQSWWQGCSLPRRAAKSILKTLDATGRVSCYLTPMHAAQLRVALDKLPAEHAIVALVPDQQLVSVMLRCDDFSTDITAHRLLFASGADWEKELARVFDENPGLPTPEQFIRGAAADHEATNALIPIAEKIFAAQTSHRSEKIKILREGWSPAKRALPRICLIAPSHFQLWEDGGEVLAGIFAEASGKNCEVVRFDSDNPASAAPLALAELASECDAVVSLNIARADLPEILSPEIPWLTWLVREQIPAGDVAGSRDVLMLADAQLRSEAIAKGWKAEHVETACWPAGQASIAQRGEHSLLMMVNTRSIEAPPRITDMSSQRLLWEAIAEEIAADPFVATPDPAKYLRRRQRDLQIPEEGFDASLFLNFLIAPAFAQSLTRLMLKEKLPLRLAGSGWESLPEFSDICSGPIRSRTAFTEAIASSQSLVYAWPLPHAHAIDTLGKPVLRPAKGRSAFLAAARSAMQGQLAPPPPAQRVLDAEMILRLLGKN